MGSELACLGAPSGNGNKEGRQSPNVPLAEVVKGEEKVKNRELRGLPAIACIHYS
jgi:hypothetical protein